MTIPEEIMTLLVSQWKGELMGAEAAAQLASWLSVPAQAEEAARLFQVWELSGTWVVGYTPDTDTALMKFRQRLASEGRPRRVRRAWLLAAASVLLLLSVGGYRWLLRPQEAVLIRTMAAVSTEPMRVSLPDGSLVILQQGSEISFPETYEAEDTRWVLLRGEAYLNIVSDTHRLFQVRTLGAVVQVLGTAFNVRAMPGEEAVEVTVEAGKVSLAPVYRQEEVLLLYPGDRGHCHTDGDLQKTKDENLNAMSWLTNKLRFRNAALEQVVEALERHYDITLQLDRSALRACLYTAQFDDLSVEDALQTVALSFGARLIRQSDGHYFLKGGACQRSQ
jgi:ferric-dicitrate binding protein FerR (iron transport regulator)